MSKITRKITVGIVTMLFISFCFNSNLFARHHRRYHGHSRHYRCHDNNWWIGDTILAGGLVLGALINSLPPQHKVIYVRKVPYYYDGTYYYRPVEGGYVVVEDPTYVVPATPPVVITPSYPAVSQEGERVTVNIPNRHGSYTAIVLTKKGNGYLGPQGEYYQGHPSVEQLQALYGD